PFGSASTANFRYSLYATYQSQGPDTQPPTVSSVSPAAGATSVATSSNVSAQFSESIDPASVTGSSFQLRDGGGALVAATVSSSGQSATLDPTPTLTAGATYTATLKGGSSGVKDLAGNALASDFSWSFTTLGGTVSTFGTTVPGSSTD